MYDPEQQTGFQKGTVTMLQSVSNNDPAGTIDKERIRIPAPSKGKVRIVEIDMVKGVVILFIFFIHLFDTTGITELYLSYTNWLYSGATLLFMIICFLCSGYVYSGEGTALKKIAQKAKQLLIPRVKFGLAFLAVYFLRYVMIEARSVTWFMDNAMSNIVGLQNWNIRLGQAYPNQMLYAFAAYWFVDELFTAFCIFIPLRKLTEGRTVYARVGVILALLTAAGLCNQFDIQHTLETTYTTNVPYFFILINAFGISALLMTGDLLKEVRFFEPEKHSKVFSFTAAGVSLALFILYVITDKADDYALQYGKWGSNAAFSILTAAIISACLLYLMVFVFQYVKRVSLIKRALCFLGRNTMDILLLHIGVAEIITWIGGFWQDYYNEPFRAEQFSVCHCLVIFGGTIAFLTVYFLIRSRYPRIKRSARRS